MERLYKYTPEDFGDLNVNVLHMDLDFDVHDKSTTVASTMHLKTKKPVQEITLNAKNLDIHDITVPDHKIHYEYKKDKDLIAIRFEEPLPDKFTFTIKTKSTCTPTKNVLEGIYYDETPKDAPPQQITQCQQWGFQRIVPCIDDMTAKCTYKTKITADARYTNLLTNGDLVKDVTPIKEGRVQVEYHNTKTPMATYLFFLGVGTYATFKREFEYEDGDTFMLELLVPPDSDEKIAHHALDVLHECILWVRLFTGKETYKDTEKRKQLNMLIKKREALKKAREEEKNEEKTKENANQLAVLRKQIKLLGSELHLGYKYTGTVYREIGMQNSDFGGMENVGNTTITTNRIMPFPDMTDPRFEYLVRVKVHEYYHNLNGSEVTGRSPFEIWLNEAVTVFIETQHHADTFGQDYSRIQRVQTLLEPTTGTLSMDEGTTAMPVEPDGFNDPNELITSVTYVKAPEFVRMIETLMGKETFVKGLDLYHTRFKHSNASRADWVKAMEEAAKTSFAEMAHTWLKTTGYPIVHVTKEYDTAKKTLILTVKQRHSAEKEVTFEFPFVVALCNKHGDVLAEKTERISKKKQIITFTNVEEPSFVSVNRGYSFFGKVEYNQSETELLLQAKVDKDGVNRYLAWYTLTDQEKQRILRKNDKEGNTSKETREEASISSTLLKLFKEIITDKETMMQLGAQMLRITEAVEDKTYAHRYKELYTARKQIRKAIAEEHKKLLEKIYEDCAKEEKQREEKEEDDAVTTITNKETAKDRTYLENQVQAIKVRQLKNRVLSLLAVLDSEDVHKRIKEQFLHATNATDRVTALSLYANSTAPDAQQLLREYQKIARENLVRWESYLGIVGSSDAHNAIAFIKEIEQSPFFRIEQANDQRALYVSFAYNKKQSLQTKEGREFLKEIILKLAPINEYTTGRILQVFAHVDSMDEEYHVPLISILQDVLHILDVEKTPSVVNTIKRMLKGSPKACDTFKKSNSYSK